MRSALCSNRRPKGVPPSIPIAVAALLGCLPAALCLSGSADAAPERRRRAPDRGRYHFDLAQVHQRYGAHKEAAGSYAKALKLAEHRALKIQILTAWGEWLVQQGKGKEGRGKLEAAMAIAEDDRARCRLALSLAAALEQEGKADDAAAQYAFVVSHSTEAMERETALSQLISGYEKAGKLGVIVKKYEDALAEDPKDATALQALLVVHTRVKPDPTAAMSVCRRLAKIRPNDTSVLRELADLQMRGRHAAQALATYKKLLEKDPARKRHYCERISDAYLMTRQHEKAIVWAMKVVETDPKSSRAWMYFADVCVRARRGDEAVGALQSAVAAADTTTERETAQLRLADLLRSRQEEDKAMAIYERLASKAITPHVKQRAARMLSPLKRRGKGAAGKTAAPQPGK